MSITTRAGENASVLGLASRPGQDVAVVEAAFEAGVNYFFFYTANDTQFAGAIRELDRDRVVVASGSGARSARGLVTARGKLLRGLRTEQLDVFFAEYIHPEDDAAKLDRVFDELCAWKEDGLIRYVGATAHDREIARKLVEDDRVDVLMHRFNMAHRKAAQEVFPYANKPIVAFTATRWATLLEGHAKWKGDPPTAADCYRYCLTHDAIRVVLTAPRDTDELVENLAALEKPMMTRRERDRWERYGDLIYGKGADAYETEWP